MLTSTPPGGAGASRLTVPLTVSPPKTWVRSSVKEATRGAVTWREIVWVAPRAVAVIWAGYRLMHESVNGLMDRALPAEDLEQVRTIIDANMTHLIASLILFELGSGPVKGFAVALGIGIITSFFTAVMVTRLIVITWLNTARPRTLTI